MEVVLNIIIFASGAGSTTQAIIDYFRKRKCVKISLIVTNNNEAGVLQIAEKEQIPFLVINDQMMTEEGFVNLLKGYDPSLIVLAGFLRKIPLNIISAFSTDRPNIINIHPSLLPKYGGKNMYGMKVHEAVIKSGDKISGMTAHYVSEEYDKGKILTQIKCMVSDKDTPETLEKKVKKLEKLYYPTVIDHLLGTYGH